MTKCVELYNNDSFSVNKDIQTVVNLSNKSYYIKASLALPWFEHGSMQG